MTPGSTPATASCEVDFLDAMPSVPARAHSPRTVRSHPHSRAPRRAGHHSSADAKLEQLADDSSGPWQRLPLRADAWRTTCRPQFRRAVAFTLTRLVPSNSPTGARAPSFPSVSRKNWERLCQSAETVLFLRPVRILRRLFGRMRGGARYHPNPNLIAGRSYWRCRSSQ